MIMSKGRVAKRRTKSVTKGRVAKRRTKSVTKRKGTKRKGTKRKGAKRKGTKRKGTKRKSSKRNMKGGAIRLPSEYFGKDSGRYGLDNHKGVSFLNTNLSYSP
jgi:hypothetical protein